MAKKSDLSKVKDCSSIQTNGKYVIVKGKYLRIFNPDGSLIAECKSVRRPYKLAFLPEDRLLVGGRDYNLLSLSNGEVIWTLPTPPNFGYSSDRFALSPDYRFAYEHYRTASTVKDMILTIDLNEPAYSYRLVQNSIRTVSDIICDKDGEVLLLQRHLANVEGKDVYQNGIFRPQRTAEGGVEHWKYLWLTDTSASPKVFDGEYVLYSNMTVIKAATGEVIDLLEHEAEWKAPRWSPLRSYYDPEKQYLQLVYDDANIIIDCVARKRIAQYSTPDSGIGFEGCLINGEFWIGTREGIIKRPFPLIEEIPKQPFSPLADFMQNR